MICGKRALTAMLTVAAYAVLFLGILPSSARAEDIIQILDGKAVEGYIIEETEDYVLIRLKTGDIQEISWEIIDYVKRGPAFEEEFKQKLEKLENSQDADAVFELGMWQSWSGR